MPNKSGLLQESSGYCWRVSIESQCIINHAAGCLDIALSRVLHSRDVCASDDNTLWPYRYLDFSTDIQQGFK